MIIWCVSDASKCWCRGEGWVLSDWDTWHKCRYHYDSKVPHPESEPDEWDYYYDTVEGDGQFMVIPYAPVTEEGRLLDAWEYHARWLIDYDNMGDLPF